MGEGLVRTGVGFNHFFLVEKNLHCFSEFSLGDIFRQNVFFPLIFYGFSDADCYINVFHYSLFSYNPLLLLPTLIV